MQPNELRIGNYVYDRGVPVDLRHSQLVNIITGKHLVYNPIPISEDWLLKLGFEKWEWCDNAAFIPLFFGDSLYCRFYNQMWHIKKLKVGRDSKGVYGKTSSKYIIPKGKVRYIHQLQNLYFALTGKELEYNAYKSKTFIGK